MKHPVAQTQDLADLRPIIRFFQDDGLVPNNPTLPVLIVRGAILPGQGSAAIIRLLVRNRWIGNWHYTIYNFQHYHPNSHEVLIVASGQAAVQLGGDSGEIFEVSDGDVLVLPAGTGHCRLEGTHDFTVCGGYPVGQENCELVRAGAVPIADALMRIALVPMPGRCPIFSETGPLMTAWSG